MNQSRQIIDALTEQLGAVGAGEEMLCRTCGWTGSATEVNGPLGEYCPTCGGVDLRDVGEGLAEATIMGKRYRPGDAVKFHSGPIQGRFQGTIDRVYGSGRVSVKADVNGQQRTFRPDMDRVSLVVT